MRTSARHLAAALLLLPVALPFACSPVERDFGGGEGGGTTTTTTTTTVTCEAGTTASCYSGPDGTEGVGLCAAGTQVCNADGTGFGACEGEVLPGVEDCATPEDEDCDGLTPPCPLTTLWTRGFPSAGLNDFPRVAADAAGNVIVAGTFSGQLDLGDGQVLMGDGSDVFVLKLAPDGALVWFRQYGGIGSQRIRGIGVDGQDGIHIAGTFNNQIDLGNGPVPSNQGSNDIFVARLSPEGDLDWSRFFGGPSFEDIIALTVDAAGRPTLTGTFSGAVNFGGMTVAAVDGEDIFVVKLAPQGSPTAFARSFSTVQGGSERPTAIASDSFGNTLLTGHFSGSIDFGSAPVTSAGNDDVFLTRLNTAGSGISTTRFGEASSDISFDVEVDSMDGSVLTGHYQGIVDFGGGPMPSVGPGTNFFLASFAQDGGHRWSMRFGESEGFDHIAAVDIDGQGNTLVGGYFGSELRFGDDVLSVATPNQDVDIFLAKIDSSGQPVAARSFGTVFPDGAFDVAVDPSGAVFLVGVTLGPGLDFGTGELPPPGPDVTYFVTKFAP